MPYRIVIQNFGSSQAPVAQEGPDYSGPEPTLSPPIYFDSDLMKAASFSVENLSEDNDARIWFADTNEHTEVPTDSVLLPAKGGMREFPFQGDHYSGYLMGAWVSDGGGAPGQQGPLVLSVIKSVHFCKE
jgi:hypothetical protein